MNKEAFFIFKKKVFSDRLFSSAIDYISSSDSHSSRGKISAGLPSKTFSENASI